MLVSESNNPKRKLRYSWEMVRIGRKWVGLNTLNANRLAEEAIAAGKIVEFEHVKEIHREVMYGSNSRIDLVLDTTNGPCYVEVKNAHLMRTPGLAEFPDSVTKRGTKHLRELTKLSQLGTRSVVLIVVQRQDCERFSVAADLDPAFAKEWKNASAKGVEMLCYACTLSVKEIVLNRSLPIVDPGAA